MTDVQIEAGTLTANFDDRTISGLLLPYGELGNTNLGKFSVADGVVQIPRDVSVVGLNTDHTRESPVGRAATLTSTPAGIVATFTVANTPEGDAALADAANPAGTRRKLSAEVSNLVLRAGEAVSGKLFGAALVAQGAFPSATLLAADVGTLLPDPTAVPAVDPNAAPAGPIVTVEKTSEEFTTPDGLTATKTTTITTTVDGTTTTIETVETIDEPTTPEGTPAVAVATAPKTLNASKAVSAKTALSFLGLTRSLGQAKATGDANLFATIAKEAGAAESLFAALADIGFDGVGDPGVAINQIPQWLGELWSGRTPSRKIIPLIGSAPLTSLNIAGWRFKTKPEVAPWAGNKAAITSAEFETEAYTVKARRLAGAHDIAREYRDFDVPGFWEGYFRGMTESYDRQADAGTLLDLLTAATPIVRGTVPAGVSPAMVSIVDGALSILDDGIPSFAVVAKDAYRDILLTRNDDTLTYLNASLGLEEGTITSFRVVPHAGLDAGDVLVGAKEAATSHELAGVPIRVEGLDMVRGGIDTGVFGYYGTVIHNAKALSLVSAV